MVIGAVLFYVSDVMVARDRFVKSDAWNRWIGLPLYYGGQMVLAYTAGLVLPPA
ncbi:MAG TPA: lysoplasmalogenase family protein [Candidatus Hydrogenedentes bacterium]|nr:lysoplasmalogenase family protein [Candidatus Hydrogenedentota bacterium]